MDNDCINCSKKGSIVERRETGFMECMACGYSFGTVIDLSDVRYGTETGSNVRGPSEVNSKMDSLLPHISMSSYLTGKGHHMIKQLQIWGRVPARERSLSTVFDLMQQKLQHSGLEGKIMDDAKIYYHTLFKAIETIEELDLESESDEIKIKKKKKDVLTRGNNREGLIAYCVQLSCEKHHIRMPDIEIANLFDISIDTLKSGKKKFNNIVNEKQIYLDIYDEFYSTEDTLKKYLPSFNFSINERKLCFVIAKRVEQLRLLKSKEPSSTVAGIIFFVSWLSNKHLDENFNKKKIALICQKSEPTVMKVFNTLEQHKEYILPKKK